MLNLTGHSLLMAPLAHSLWVDFFQRTWRRFLQESVSEQREVLVSIQLSLFKVLPVPLPISFPLPQPVPLLLKIQVCARWQSFEREPVQSLLDVVSVQHTF